MNLHNLERTLTNPLAVIGLATLGGWIVGTGIVALPMIGGGTPAAAPAPAASVPAAPAPAPTAVTAAIATLPSSSDALAGWNL